MSRAILITGAEGYVGRLVTRAIAADRRDIGRIIAVDVRPSTAPLLDVEHVVGDVRGPEIRALLEKHPVDTVVHLAAIVTPGKKSSPELEYSVDVEGTKNVLEACIATGVKKLIVTSSGAAYGYHADNAPLLDEDCPIRGNDEFPYSRHKRLVEEMLAKARKEHPELGQLVLRPGTILGRSVKNQITAIFERPFVLGLSDAATPFVFIWDQDVVACIVEGIHGDRTGIYNLAGDGVMTLREIAAALGKPFLPVPSKWLERGLAALKRLDLAPYGPEQVRFLKYRPVLANERLKREFGYTPKRSSREVFDLYAGRA